MALRMGEHLGPARERVGVRLAGPHPKRMTAARNRVLAVCADGLIRSKGEIAEEAGVSAGVIDGLIDEGTLETLVLPPDPVAPAPDPDFAQPDFRRRSRWRRMRCARRSQAGGYSATLLDGVTGSGKTAVYLEAVAETIRRGRQALILMPEIALTSQVLDRFAERFGVRPAEWHSQLSQRLRQRTWAAVASGEATVTVGARSALFLPYKDLGLIVVDEEHDPAYKQEDGVRYHARDMAVVRASVSGIPIVLASATPSVETEVNARRGRYKKLSSAGTLRRPASARHRADRLEARGPAARPLHRAAARRGRARPRSTAASRRCCSSTAAALRRSRSAAAAAIGWPARTATPGWSIIASAGGSSAITAASRCRCRTGARNATRRNRSRRSVPASSGWSTRRRSCSRKRASSCSPAISWNRWSACARSSTTSREGRFDIVIGTQLVAKGHHFPKLNLVGIVDADLGPRTAIRARPSARSSCCIRWSAAPAARKATASASCRRISPSIR